MAFSLTWLSEVLTRAGLKVSEVPGWQGRGRAEMGRVFGVICHHTVGAKTGNMPSLNNLIKGDAALAGPKAQLGLARDGTFFVIAAGRANHAGKGQFKDPTTGKLILNGNSNFIGIECENTGLETDFPWPDVQMEALRRGVAAILTHLRLGPAFCLGHKEWAQGRKIDPLFKMIDFRTAVNNIMNGSTPAPVLIPPVERPGDPVSPGRPTLRRGMSGALTKELQAKLGLTADGVFGPKTEAAVRQFQRDKGVVPDGIVGPRTWAALDAAQS
jgi:hypothetical protein